MRQTTFRTLCMTGLLALSAVVVQAQDSIVTPKTKTEATTSTPAKVTPKPKQPVKQTPKPKATTGELLLSSTPSGAAVKIGGKYIGETPLILDRQKPQTYSVTFSAEGYESQTHSVTVIAGNTVTCSASLDQLENPDKQPKDTTYVDFTVDGVAFKMIRVEGGTFIMGATSEQGGDAYDNEKPTHVVTLSSYYIGETEVTQELWQAVMGNNPSYFKGNNLPVEQVSWSDCQTFINRLDSITGKDFRLPTEAEWEFAARGGAKSQGFRYSGSNTLGNVAWYEDNSGDETHPVKAKNPNELGLYDLSGNVWEWCQNWFGEYNYNPLTNPIGERSGEGRVCRGGGLANSVIDNRVTCRGYNLPDSTSNVLGLRLVTELQDYSDDISNMQMDIFYDAINETNIPNSQQQKIDKLVSFLISNPETKVIIRAYASAGDSADPRLNIKVSYVRAEKVAYTLKKAHVDMSRIIIRDTDNIVFSSSEKYKNRVNIAIVQ